MHKFALAAVAICAASPSALLADPISGAGSLPGGTMIVLPEANYTGGGPQDVGGGITWSSNQSNSLYGWTGAYNVSNAVIGPGPNTPLIGLNDGFDTGTGGYATMTLTFATPTSGVLAEIFWSDFTSNGNSANIAIYNSAHQLLEYFPFNNNGNPLGYPSGYYGFYRAAGDIASIDFNNGFIGARNISYVAPVDGVPEPATWAMMLIGFGAAGMAMRRQRNKIALLQLA
jgi:hypothetical protein